MEKNLLLSLTLIIILTLTISQVEAKLSESEYSELDYTSYDCYLDSDIESESDSCAEPFLEKLNEHPELLEAGIKHFEAAKAWETKKCFDQPIECWDEMGRLQNVFIDYANEYNKLLKNYDGKDEAIEAPPEKRVIKEETVEAQEVIKETKEIGDIDQWKEILVEETGTDSAATKGLANCEAAIKAQIQTCPKKMGWMVDNAMEIEDFSSDAHYEYQQIEATGGCLQGDAERTKIDTKFFDSGKDDYQVVCSINCYTWTCEKAPVENYQGKVEIQQEGTWKELDKDTSVKSGDVIKTGSTGTVKINLDKIQLVLGPESTVEVEALDSLLLKAGKLWALVGTLFKGNQMRVKTPGAVHAIRGTEFILDYEETEGTTTLHLRSGEIEITSSSGEVRDVFAGQTTITTKEGLISEQELTEEDW